MARLPLPDDFSPERIPARLKERICTSESLTKFNAEHGLTGEACYLPYEDEVEEMTQWIRKMRVPRVLLERWSTHPDERVLCVLMEEGMLTGHSLDLRIVVYRRAVQDAAAEGVAWTRVLDVMASHHSWPETRQEAQCTLETKGGEIIRLHAASERKHAETLRDWFYNQRTADRLEWLSECESTEVHRVAAEEVRLHTPGALDLVASDPHLWKDLFGNTSFSRQTAEWLFYRALEFATDPEKRRETNRAAPALLAMQRQGVLMPEPLLRALATHALLEESPRPEKLSPLNTIVQAPNLPHDLAEELYAHLEHHRGPADAQLHALLSRTSNVEVCRAAFRRHGRMPDVRSALVANRAARFDPEMRRSFLRSRSDRVMEKLCGDASPDEFAMLVSRLASSGSVQPLLRVLQRALPDQLAGMPPKAWAALLASRSAEVREVVLRTHARVMSGGMPDAEQEEPAQRPRRRRR